MKRTVPEHLIKMNELSFTFSLPFHLTYALTSEGRRRKGKKRKCKRR